MNLSQLLKYLTAIRRWWWLLVLLPGVAVGVSYLSSRSFTPIYQAHALFMVSGGQGSKTVATLMTTSKVLQEVANDPGLHESAAGLAGAVVVVPRADGGFLDVTVTHRNPSTAQAVANRLVEAFQRQQGQQPANPQVSTLEEQTKQLGQAVAADQAQVEQLRAVRLPTQSQRTDLGNAEDRLNRDTAAYASAVKSLGEVRSRPGEASGSAVQVIEPAGLPSTPINDNRSRKLQFALVAGLVAALGLVFAIGMLDQTIKDAQQFEHVREEAGLPRLPVLASILYDAPPRSGEQSDLMTLRAPHHPASEAYRTLRTNLFFGSIDRPLTTIVVTSPGPGEGKSRTCANLAVVMAQAGRRVLLIDADLRRPSQHRIFSQSSDTGLTNLFLEGGTLPELEPVPGVSNLWLLPSGPTPPNPSELLGSKRMDDVLTQLETRFDLILLDTPPIGVVTDAAILAARGGACLLVAEHGRTTYSAVELARATLKRVGADIMGILLNKERLMLGRSATYQYVHTSEAAPPADRAESASLASSRSDPGDRSRP